MSWARLRVFLSISTPPELLAAAGGTSIKGGAGGAGAHDANAGTAGTNGNYGYGRAAGVVLRPVTLVQAVMAHSFVYVF